MSLIQKTFEPDLCRLEVPLWACPVFSPSIHYWQLSWMCEPWGWPSGACLMS